MYHVDIFEKIFIKIPCFYQVFHQQFKLQIIKNRLFPHVNKNLSHGLH